MGMWLLKKIFFGSGNLTWAGGGGEQSITSDLDQICTSDNNDPPPDPLSPLLCVKSQNAITRSLTLTHTLSLTDTHTLTHTQIHKYTHTVTFEEKYHYYKKYQWKTRESRRYEENPSDPTVFRKNKNPFVYKVYGSMCTKFLVCITFLFGQEAWHKYINKYIHTYTSEIRNILNQLLASRGF